MTPSATGGAVGIAGVTASATALYELLSDPTELAGLFAAAEHRTMTPAVFTLASAAFGLIVSGAIALVSALFHPSPSTPRIVHLVAVPAPPAEQKEPQSMSLSLLQSILAKYVKPEERVLGPEIQAAYNANKGAIVQALTTKGVSAVSVLQADADALIPVAFAKVPDGEILETFLGPTVKNLVDGLVAKAAAAAPAEAAVVETYADGIVAKLVAQLES